jgi:AraC-like DNA-binding protein
LAASFVRDEGRRRPATGVPVSRPTLSLRSYAAAACRHAHDGYHQIVLPVLGAMRMDVAGTPGEIAGERAVLVARGLPHAFQVEGWNRFVVLDFPVGGGRGPDLAPGVVDLARRRPFFALDEGFRHLTLYLAYAMQDGALPEAIARQAAELVTHAVTRAMPAEAGDAAVARAIGHIHARFPRALTVADLAAEVGLSPSALHARFRLATGHTPIGYLQSVRLDEAERLLRASRLSIAEIAGRVGFSDQTALTRALRRQRGVTPGSLRRRA